MDIYRKRFQALKVLVKSKKHFFGFQKTRNLPSNLSRRLGPSLTPRSSVVAKGILQSFVVVSALKAKTSSDSNDSFESHSSESSIDLEESGDEVEVVTGEHAPYQEEPLASFREQGEESEDADHDGLTPSVLETRFERRVAVSEWLVNHAYLFVNIIKQRNCSVIMALPCLRCKCKQCSDETLADALESRCCREVTNAKRQLAISRNTKITAL